MENSPPQTKNNAETKSYYFHGLRSKIWGTPKPEERMKDCNVIVDWTTSFRDICEIGISGILLIRWSPRDAVVWGKKVHKLQNYSCYNNVFCCISSHLAKELFFPILENYIIA